jgi:hypothetical protein
VLSALALGGGCHVGSSEPDGSSIWDVNHLALNRPAVAGEWSLITVNHGVNVFSDSFVVSDTNLAVVDQDGRLFARAAGTVTLTVLRNGRGLSMPVTIAPAPTDQFPVRFEFIGWSPSRPERAAFERAAVRYQTVLREVDAPVNIDLASSECMAPFGTYTNLTGIVVQVGLQYQDPSYDDGSFADVGTSDGCVVDPVTGRSKVISMYLSPGRLAQYADPGFWQEYRTLENLILHEVGHGLRLVTVERSTPVPIDRSNEEVPRFTGAHAVEAWVALGGEGGVPLTRDERHWESLVGADFMFSSTHPLSMISPLSLGALADYGYGALLDRAEPRVQLLHDWVQEQ